MLLLCFLLFIFLFFVLILHLEKRNKKYMSFVGIFSFLYVFNTLLYLKTNESLIHKPANRLEICIICTHFLFFFFFVLLWFCLFKENSRGVFIFSHDKEKYYFLYFPEQKLIICDVFLLSILKMFIWKKNVFFFLLPCTRLNEIGKVK